MTVRKTIIAFQEAAKKKSKRLQKDLEKERSKRLKEASVIKTYLIFDGRHYKIGRSMDPERRLIDFRIANPTVKLLAYGIGIDEKSLHKLYKKYRVVGEWFKLSNTHVDEIVYSLKHGLPTPANPGMKVRINGIMNECVHIGVDGRVYAEIE